IEEAAARVAPVESDIACRLLERRDPDPAVLERLRGQGRSLLDRDMRTRKLSDRVVAVADEDPFVELLGAANRDHVVIGRPGAGRKPSPTGRAWPPAIPTLITGIGGPRASPAPRLLVPTSSSRSSSRTSRRARRWSTWEQVRDGTPCRSRTDSSG